MTEIRKNFDVIILAVGPKWFKKKKVIIEWNWKLTDKSYVNSMTIQTS